MSIRFYIAGKLENSEQVKKLSNSLFRPRGEEIKDDFRSK